MTREAPYASPAAFRRALTDRLREIAKTGKWTLPHLQRQFAYDRLLERLYLIDDGWIVKGATALLARDIGARGTIDIDLYRKVAAEIAETDLRAAAERDIGDWFRFELGPAQRATGDAMGIRVPSTAYIGTGTWAQFHVDLVGTELVMTGDPEPVPPLARVVMPNVEQHGYRAYPLVDHIADKITATLRLYGAQQMPSTRYKDLVDLVAIVTEASVPADAQETALASEAKRRGITLPRAFDVPDRSLWERGYAAEAKRALMSMARTLDEALAIVKAFIDPLLEGKASGRWDPTHARWA